MSARSLSAPFGSDFLNCHIKGQKSIDFCGHGWGSNIGGDHRLALNCQKGQHLPALEVYQNQSPRI